MKRHKVVILDDASADIVGIYDYVLESSLNGATAERFVRRIVDACRRLGDMPMAGRRCDHLLPGLRSFPFEKRALIIYRLHDDEVHIVNVFYGGRDYEALYAGRPSDDPS